MSQRYSRSEKAKWVAGSLKVSRRSPVRIPQSDNSAIIAENKLSLIGRVTNPMAQKPKVVVLYLPQFWNLENRVTGRDLGTDLFIFRFQEEADLQWVLKNGPYHYKNWMLILQRWEPNDSPSFPATIPFWIRIHKLPFIQWTNQTVRTIGKELGPVLDQDAANARVRVAINGLTPLEMKLPIRLPHGEIMWVEFEYEKLEKHCFICLSLSHEKKHYPSLKSQDAQPHRSLGISQQLTLNKIEADRKRSLEKKDRHTSSRSLPYKAADSHAKRIDTRESNSYRHSRRSSPMRNRNALSTHYRRHSPPQEFQRNSKDSTRSHSEYRRSRDPHYQSHSHRYFADRVSQSTHSRGREYSRRDPQENPLRENLSSSHISRDPLTPPPPSPIRNLPPPPSPTFKEPIFNSATPASRRPALERLSNQVTPRTGLEVSLSAGSSRLQDIEIQYLHGEDLENPFGSHPRANVFSPGQTSSPRERTRGDPPPSACRTLVLEQQDTRVHTSLRLGPLDSPAQQAQQGHSLSVPKSRKVSKKKAPKQPSQKGPKGPRAPKGPSKLAAKERINKISIPRTHVSSCPLQGISLRKRNVSRVNNSTRKRLCVDNPAQSVELPPIEDATTPATGPIPAMVLTPATSNGRVDFRFPPDPLP